MKKVLLILLLIGWMPVAIGQVAGIYTQDTVVPYGQHARLKLVVEGAEGPFQMTYQRDNDPPETKVAIPRSPFSWGEEITQTMTFTLLDVKNGSNKKIEIDPAHRVVTVKLSGTGVEELGSPFAVYPNPTPDILHIEIEGDDVQFDIFDALGKHVMSGDIHNQSIDVSDLKRGLYILIVVKEGEKVSATFLKE